MADEFVTVEVESDAQTLADEAVDRLREQWPDWEPNDGDIEVIQIETLAPMAANAAETAGRVPREIFYRYGTDLKGLPPRDGVSATTTTTWTLASNPAGRLIPAGAEIDIDGYAFSVNTQQDIPAGTTVRAGVTVSSVERTAEANGLTGTTVVAITSLDWVESVAVNATTSGGADAEDVTSYLDRLARRLQLHGETLVTLRDFELYARDDPAVGRALAINNGERAVLVTATDLNGEPLAQAVKDRLVAVYADFRQVNTTVTVANPTYTTVNVTYSVKAYPGFNSTDLIARINGMLADLLSPKQWGAPEFGDPVSTGQWLNETVVRRNKVIDVIGDAQGVNYVESLSLAGSGGTFDGNNNLVLPGTVPLTRAGTFTGSTV